MSGKIILGIGRRYPEGLMVAIAEDLAPNPNMPEIIGNMTLGALARVFQEAPLQLRGPLNVLIPADPSPRPGEIELGVNWEAGQVLIRLPAESGRTAVQRINSSLLQNIAAGAVTVEGARRATSPLTGEVLQRLTQLGSDACAAILGEINEQVRANVGEGVKLNLLPEPPEIAGYDFLAALGLHPSSSEDS